MEFIEFKQRLQVHVSNMIKDQEVLFVTNTDKEIMWNKYLDSFPPGTNEIFRERREFDCSCCRQFIKSFGNVVAIKDNEVISIWDFKTEDDKFQPVIDKLSEYIKSKPVNNIFITKESGFGTDHNFEQLDCDTVHTWHHFRIALPKKIVTKSSKTTASLMGEYRDIKNVFKRSLEEISDEAIKTVLDLIAQKSLYKGEEWQGVLTQFFYLHNKYHELPEEKKDNYCWSKIIQVGGVIGKIRNHSMGVLLINISKEVNLNEAVKTYERIVAPTNYKRPKAIFTKKMVEQAQKTITEIGLFESLGRRFATINDITINNILFANKDIAKRMTGDVFTELQQETISNPKKFDKIEEVPMEHFIQKILPKVTNVEIFFENRHISNLISLIAPQNRESKSMFKWSNNFSWAYNGNITDSMKERVKALGGNVEGVLRFSIQWNEKGNNNNDFDAHSLEPGGNEIYYPNKARTHLSSGMLDVDIICPERDIENNVAVENIIYTDLNKMPQGIYTFLVHVFTNRGGRGGFSAEIEFDKKIHSFEYCKNVRVGEKIIIAKIKYDKAKGFEIIESLPSSLQSKTIWNINTNQFVPASTIMYSPNYWDQQTGIGHKHYLFILKDCKNDTQPNGFFNEFLQEDLLVHKRVFEALGSKMSVKPSNEQLSGIGFSNTKRNSMICKLEGSFTRMIKLTF